MTNDSSMPETIAGMISGKVTVKSVRRALAPATSDAAFEGDGYVHWCEGNFQVYETQRHERMGVDADQPHRFRYKKLQQH